MHFDPMTKILYELSSCLDEEKAEMPSCHLRHTI